jgi:Ring finger domain
LKEENFVVSETVEKSTTRIQISQKSMSMSNSASEGETDEDNNVNTGSDVEVPSRAVREEETEPVGGDMDEEGFVWIPEPGLPRKALLDFLGSGINSSNNLQGSNHSSGQDTSTPNNLRQVPNECSICLCEYTVGSDVVWSSNPQCDHVFHENCIEQWLMKQREGPLCPCCRRDFVIDPFDDVEAFLCDIVPLDGAESGGTAEGADPTIQTIHSDVVLDSRA